MTLKEVLKTKWLYFAFCQNAGTPDHKLCFGGAKIDKLGAWKKGNIIMAQNSTQKFQKEESY